MKNFAKFLISSLIKMLGYSKIGRFIETTLITQAMSQHSSVTHKNVKLDFVTPNALTKWRVKTFCDKEPETLEWIDNMSDNDVFWDVGANIGLYSIYAAKRHKIPVFSFEPSIFNLELLGRNCAINEAAEFVSIIPLALSDKMQTNKMRHSTTNWGGALSAFGASYGSDGTDLHSVLEYRTLGLSADELIQHAIITPPSHIKIDVDGIEHIVLRGAKEVLLSTKSVLIEVNENFTEQFAEVSRLLENSGFTLTETHASPYTETREESRIFNQIWKRTNATETNYKSAS